MNWDDLGDAILYLDTSTLYVDSSFSGSTGTVTVLVTDSNWSFVALATIQLGTNIVTISSQTCDGRNIVTNFGGSEHSGVTIAYKHKEGVWSSKYSFLPTNYTNIGNALYSFFSNDNGVVWRHNVSDTRNNFYGVQYGSMFEIVSNRNPSMIKTFKSLGIEGDGTWTVSIKTSKQETEMSYFEQKEGHQYGMIPRDIVNSTSHKIYLGKVDSLNNNSVTFSTPVNRLPYAIGDSVKAANGNQLDPLGATISSIQDRKTIVLSSTTNVNIGDDIFVEKSSIVDGDPMRDVYASFKMESNDQDKFEVHALSVVFDRSRLHNDRVN